MTRVFLQMSKTGLELEEHSRYTQIYEGAEEAVLWHAMTLISMF